MFRSMHFTSGDSRCEFLIGIGGVLMMAGVLTLCSLPVCLFLCLFIKGAFSDRFAVVTFCTHAHTPGCHFSSLSPDHILY